MSNFCSAATIVLAAIIHASLQLSLGCLLLLYHESAGKHIKKQTRRLSSTYIAGVGTIVFLLLATTIFLIHSIFEASLPTCILAIIVGILIALALVMWLFYYRRGETTELWLPKTAANFINRRAALTNNTTEAFSLGVLTCFAEFLFVAIPLIVAASSILELDVQYRAPLVAIYTIIAIVPLIIFRLAIRTGKNVVDIQKWRVRNKFFLRTISGAGFFVLAAFLFAFELLGYK